MYKGKDLAQFSNIELQEELDRRKQLNLPKPLTNIDWLPVISNAEAYINERLDEGNDDSDIPHYIFESVITAVYGKNIWATLNDFDD